MLCCFAVPGTSGPHGAPPNLCHPLLKQLQWNYCSKGILSNPNQPNCHHCRFPQLLFWIQIQDTKTTIVLQALAAAIDSAEVRNLKHIDLRHSRINDGGKKVMNDVCRRHKIDLKIW